MTCNIFYCQNDLSNVDDSKDFQFRRKISCSEIKNFSKNRVDRFNFRVANIQYDKVNDEFCSYVIANN